MVKHDHKQRGGNGWTRNTFMSTTNIFATMMSVKDKCGYFDKIGAYSTR
ncbi:hypothetical protein GCM10011391_30760 [Pullulanibacillus camelliae]|uniref:Uncharacterized protein n=1 Tax=Pullulanibacillus camelliae TaxID=1707096 RepID=A0A8J2YLD2_9BACL|nr:hypothetical protein GCM10011391_30760 [Pullulanibacillus camelliae]